MDTVAKVTPRRQYMVKALTHQGRTIVLKSGFRSEDAALDFPVRLKFWQRVWVEPHGIKPEHGLTGRHG